MYAIIETGGKEYNVQKGSTIEVEKLAGKKGDEIEFDRVMLIVDKDDVKIGKPYIKGAKVLAEVLDQKKARKIIVFRRRPKKGFKRKIGHRQLLTELKIKEISAK